MEFIQELKKLGLKDKEAAVYLASLALGPSPVQNIARRAKVVRATTYVILEDLMHKGLITHYKEGKKTLFSAEPPLQLNRILEKESDSIKDKQRQLDKILPELQVLMKSSGQRPSIRYFEGKEGLHAMRQEIMMYSTPGDIVYNFTPLDSLDAVFPENAATYHIQRAARGIRAKTIFSTHSPALKELLFAQSKQDKTERRFVAPGFFPSTSGMTIYRDRIAIGSFAGKLMGVIIESESMAEMMRNLFELAWVGADHIDHKE